MAKKKIKISKSEYDYLYEQAVRMVYVETIVEAIQNKTTLINEVATIDKVGKKRTSEREIKTILNSIKNVRFNFTKNNLIPQVIDGNYYLIPHTDIKIDLVGNPRYPAELLLFKVEPRENPMNNKYELKVSDFVTVDSKGGVSEYPINEESLVNLNPKINVLNNLYWDSFDEIGYDIFDKSKNKPEPADKDRESPITEEDVKAYKLAKQEAEKNASKLEPEPIVSKPTNKKVIAAKKDTEAEKKRKAELEKRAKEIEQEILKGKTNPDALDAAKDDVKDAKKRVAKAKAKEEGLEGIEVDDDFNTDTNGQYSLFGDEDSESENGIVDEPKDENIDSVDSFKTLKQLAGKINRAYKSFVGKPTSHNENKLNSLYEKWDATFDGESTFDIRNSIEGLDSALKSDEDFKEFLESTPKNLDVNKNDDIEDGENNSNEIDTLSDEDDPQGNNAEIKRVMASYKSLKRQMADAKAEFDDIDNKILSAKNPSKKDIEKRNLAKEKLDSLTSQIDEIQPTVDVIRNVLHSPLGNDVDDSEGDVEKDVKGDVEDSNEYFTLKEINTKIKSAEASLKRAKKALESDPRSNVNKKSVKDLEARLQKLYKLKERINNGEKLAKSEKAKASVKNIESEIDTDEIAPEDEVTPEDEVVSEPETPISDYEEETAKEYATKKNLANYDPNLASSDGYEGKVKDLKVDSQDFKRLSDFLKKGPTAFIKRKLNDGTFELLPKKIIKQAEDGHEGAELYFDTSNTRRAPIIKMVPNDEGGFSPSAIFLVSGDNVDTKRKSKPIGLSDSNVNKLVSAHEWLTNTPIEEYEEHQVSNEEIPVIKGAPETPIEDKEITNVDNSDEITNDSDTKSEVVNDESLTNLGKKVKSQSTKSMGDFDNGVIAKVIQFISKNGVKGPQEIDGDVLTVKIGKFIKNKIEYNIYFNYYKEGSFYALDYIDVLDKMGNSLFESNENKIHTIATETIKNKIKGSIPFDFEVVSDEDLGMNGVFKGNLTKDGVNPFSPEDDEQGSDEFKSDSIKNTPTNREENLLLNFTAKLAQNIRDLSLNNFFGEFYKGSFKMELKKPIQIGDKMSTLTLNYKIDEDDEAVIRFVNFEIEGSDILEKYIKTKDQYQKVTQEFLKNLGKKALIDTQKGDFVEMVRNSVSKGSKGTVSARKNSEPGTQDNPEKNEMAVLLADKVESVLDPKNMRYFLIDGDNRIKLFNNSDKGVGIVYDKQNDGSYLAIRITVDGLDISEEIENESAKYLKDWRKLSGESMSNFVKSTPKIDMDAEDVDYEPVGDDVEDTEQQHEPEEEFGDEENTLKPLNLDPEEEEYVEDEIEDMEEAIPHIEDNPGLRDKINAKVNQLLQKYSKGRLGNGMTNDLIRIAHKVGRTTGKGYAMGKNAAKATAYNTAKVGQALSQGFAQGRDTEDARNYDKAHNKYFRRKGDDVMRMGSDTVRRTKKAFKQIGENQENKFKSEKLNEIKDRTTRRRRNK